MAERGSPGNISISRASSGNVPDYIVIDVKSGEHWIKVEMTVEAFGLAVTGKTVECRALLRSREKGGR